MNKNIIIGLLAIVIVVGGGYYLIHNTASTSTTNTAPQATGQTTTKNGNTSTVPPLTLGTPIVETSQSVTTSISTALVTGQVVPNGVPTSYWFEYGQTTNLGGSTGSQQVGSGFYAISAPAYITGLGANTVYYFRLVAKNNFGTIAGATYNFKTNSNPPLKAAMPTVHTSSATNVSRTSANVNGQVNPQGFQTNYWFEYGKDNSLGNATSITIINANGSLTSSSTVNMTLSGLDPLTKYYFRLNAQNQFGTVNGSVLNFTTQGPLNPGAPTITTSQATNITSNSARMNGRINANGAETTYWFEYSEDSLLGNIIGSGTSQQTVNAGTSTVDVQVNVSNLNRNTKYFYRLVGRNQYGTVNGSISSFNTKS